MQHWYCGQVGIAVVSFCEPPPPPHAPCNEATVHVWAAATTTSTLQFSLVIFDQISAMPELLSSKTRSVLNLFVQSISTDTATIKYSSGAALTTVPLPTAQTHLGVGSHSAQAM